MLEVITILVAVLGLGLSVYNFVYEKWKNRRDLQIDVIDVYRFEGDIGTYDVLSLVILNKSSAPITISRIEVSCGGCSDGFGQYRRQLLKTEKKWNGMVYERNYWFSNTVPFHLDTLSYTKGLIVSDSNQSMLIANGSCQMALHTNRGTLVSEFQFNDFSPLKRLSESRAPDSQVL